MHGFEPVTLTWQEQSWTVPANKQMGLIARIEDALSGDSGEQAVTILWRKEGPPHSRMAAAFGAALRYAGASVTDEEIYLSIHRDIATGSATQTAAKVNMMILALLSIISPPMAQKISEKEAAPKNP